MAATTITYKQASDTDYQMAIDTLHKQYNSDFPFAKIGIIPTIDSCTVEHKISPCHSAQTIHITFSIRNFPDDPQYVKYHEMTRRIMKVTKETLGINPRINEGHGEIHIYISNLLEIQKLAEAQKQHFDQHAQGITHLTTNIPTTASPQDLSLACKYLNKLFEPNNFVWEIRKSRLLLIVADPEFKLSDFQEILTEKIGKNCYIVIENPSFGFTATISNPLLIQRIADIASPPTFILNKEGLVSPLTSIAAQLCVNFGIYRNAQIPRRYQDPSMPILPLLQHTSGGINIKIPVELCENRNLVDALQQKFSIQAQEINETHFSHKYVAQLTIPTQDMKDFLKKYDMDRLVH
jgi:hypothetical protein